VGLYGKSGQDSVDSLGVIVFRAEKCPDGQPIESDESETEDGDGDGDDDDEDEIDA